MEELLQEDLFTSVRIRVEKTFSDAVGGYNNTTTKIIDVHSLSTKVVGQHKGKKESAVDWKDKCEFVEQLVEEFIQEKRKNKNPQETIEFVIVYEGQSDRTRRINYGPTPKQEKDTKNTDLLSAFDFRLNVGIYDTVGYENVKPWFSSMAKAILDFVPNGRERSLALTKLEECMAWTAKAFEKNGAVVRPIPDWLNPFAPIQPQPYNPYVGDPFTYYETTNITGNVGEIKATLGDSVVDQSGVTVTVSTTDKKN